MPLIKAYADIINGVRGLTCGPSIYIYPYFLCESNDGPGESLYLRWLAWALAAGHCDEYRNLMCFLNYS